MEIFFFILLCGFVLRGKIVDSLKALLHYGNNTFNIANRHFTLKTGDRKRLYLSDCESPLDCFADPLCSRWSEGVRSGLCMLAVLHSEYHPLDAYRSEVLRGINILHVAIDILMTSPKWSIWKNDDKVISC